LEDAVEALGQALKQGVGFPGARLETWST